MKKTLLFLMLALICSTGFAQPWVDDCPEADIMLDIVEVKGSDVVIEIRLRQSATSACGSFGLGSADFVLDFNNSAFMNPTITPQGGFCDFVDKSGNGSTVQFIYETISTSATINGAPGAQQIVMNLNGPAPGNQGSFDSGVAIIDNSKEWVFGRFTISGYDGASPLGINWSVPPFGGSGLSTLLFGLEDGDYDNDGVSFLSVMILINSSSVLLDLELTAFDAAVFGRTHSKLDWETALETDLSHFLVERTVDGVNWQPVGNVQAVGNSTTSLDYSFIDRNVYLPGTGKAIFYYRLKSIDFDGTFEFSDIRAVAFNSKDAEGGLSLQPNPAFDYIEVGLNKDVTAIYDVTYQLIDVSGKVITEGRFDNSYVKLDVKHIATGMYFFRVLHDGAMMLDPKKVVIARP